MNNRNTETLNLLISLAGAGESNDEFTQLSQKHDLSEIEKDMLELMNEEKAKIRKEAAREVYGLIKTSEQKVQALVDEIRAVRRKEAELKKVIDKITQARALGGSTSNYLPLYEALGNYVPKELLDKANATRTATDNT